MLRNPLSPLATRSGSIDLGLLYAYDFETDGSYLELQRPAPPSNWAT